jgi:hypothetical protein
MPTREIPREQWKEFLDRFSRDHENKTVNVDFLGRSLGAQVEASGLPLEGVSYEDKGSGAGRIDILVGRDPDHHATHAIPNPRRLLVQDDPAGEALEIEDGDGNTILVCFREPARSTARM